MTLIDIGSSLPWSGRLTEGAVGDAGPYTHLQWQELWGNGSAYGAQANAGIVPGSYFDPTDALWNQPAYGPLEVRATAPASANVTITPGTAIVQGIKYTLDTATDVTVPANASGNPRIDAIVLRADYAGQTVRPYYLTGTAAATPVAPTLTRTGAPAGFWDIALAYIEVANGFVSIAQVSIQDGRQHISPDRLGMAINLPSGVGTEVLEAGYPLAPESTALEFFTSSLLNNHRIAGVAEHYIENSLGLYGGRLVTHGLAYVEVSEAVSVGEYLEQSASTGQAYGVTIPENAFGIALTASTGVGQKVLAIITSRIPNNPALVIVREEQAANTAGGTFTAGAWRTRVINAEVIDTSGIASIAGNQITLAKGLYEVSIRCPAYRVDGHRARLRNITAGTTLINGLQSYSPSAVDNSVSIAEIRGQILLAVTSVLEIQHWCNTTRATDGFGVAVNIDGVSEFYTFAEFRRVLT